MLSWRTTSSSPKFFLLCGRHRLKATMWWVPNQKYFRILSVPSDKLTGWLARLWLSPRRIQNPQARKWRHPRRRLLDLQSLTAWGPRPPRLRGLWHRSPPLELAPEGPIHDPSKEAWSLARLLRLPLPDNVDGSQVGARLADFAPHWRSLLGNCRATGIIEDGVGIAFQQRPQLTHQSISFPDQEQPSGPSASSRWLADEGSHRAGHQRDETYAMPTFMFRCIRLSASICVSWSTRRCTSSLVFRLDWGPLHESSPSCCDLSSRCLGSKVWSYTSTQTTGWSGQILRNRLNCTPRQPSGCSSLAGSSTSRSPISHQVKTSSSLGCSSTLDVSQWRPTEDASKGPVSSSALDDQSGHHGQRFAQTSRHAGVHGFAGPARTAPSSSSPMVGSHSMVPEDQELVRPDSSSTVGSGRDGMVVIPSSPARSTPRHQGDESNSLHRCVQLGSRSTRGQWSASQRSCHINVLEMQAVIYAVRDFLPRLRSRWCDWCATTHWWWLTSRTRGGTRSHTLMQMTIRLLKWCDPKAIALVPIHLPGVHNIQADSLSRVGQTLTTEWTMAM